MRNMGDMRQTVRFPAHRSVITCFLVSARGG